MEKKKFKLSSAQLIPVSFLAAMVVGTILLMLPAAKAGEGSADFTTAFFTSTTSICVTGLVVVDTFAYWSLFGKIVILLLIQLGGLGIIAVSSILMLALHRKFSLSRYLLVHDAFNLNSMDGVLRFLVVVFKGTFVVELFGAAVYAISFIPRYGALRGIWYSVFTAVSAFCNAGIDIIGPDSLIGFQNNPLILCNSTMLIVMGGLGYIVWIDVFRTFRWGIRSRQPLKVIIKHFNEHTKLVLSLTVILLLSGALIVFGLEYNNPDTIGSMGLGGKAMNSLFQSVTFRTAGFAAVPQQSLTEGTCFLGCIFMFIGGSPVGTAGGVKTVTFFIMLLNAVSFIRNRRENVVFSRKVTSDMVHKASAIVMVSFFVTVVLLILLMVTNDVGLVDGMYETFSATATVGLSRALTGSLNTVGRWLIIFAMFLGRIGPISMALFFRYDTDGKNKISYADGNFIVG
ncbi:MAG: potassium transporter TrkH [Lachnospiraceae bacterium]|nr:potassium transporter TrkH [Lachnospiraceae bacterium]